MIRSRTADNRGGTTDNFQAYKPLITTQVQSMTARRFNVQHYHDGRSQGSDYTVAFRRAFAAASAVKGVVYVPGGQSYIVRPQDRDDGVESLLILDIPDGVGMEGDGYESEIIFKAAGAYTIDDAHYIGFRCNGNNTLRGFRLNGNKGNISLSGDKIFRGIACVDNASNLHFADLWIHDIPASGGHESFGLILGNGVNNVTIERVKAYDNNGSGVSISGNNPAPWLEGDNGAGGVVCSDCTFERNTWQGLTIYAIGDVKVANCHAAGNLRVNYNVEYGRNIDFIGCTSTEGKQQNLRIMGASKGVRLYGCRFYHGLGTFEVSINRGGFFREIGNTNYSSETIRRFLAGATFPAVDGDFDEADRRFLLGVYPFGGTAGVAVDPTAVPTGVEFHDCRIIPAIENGLDGTVHHFQLIGTETDADLGLTNVGDHSYPGILFNSPKSELWRISGRLYHSPEVAQRRLLPGIEYRNLPYTRLVEINPLRTWVTLHASQADNLTAYTSPDAYEKHAITFTAASQGSGVLGPLALEGGKPESGLRMYHVKARVKVTQPTGATVASPDVWTVGVARDRSFGGPALQLRFGSIGDDGKWMEAEGIAYCAEGRYRVQLFYLERASGASTDGRIDVDYITVTEVSSHAAQGATGKLVNLRRVVMDELPDWDTWLKGEEVVRSTRSDGQPSGWVCTANGTYGTLTGVTVNATEGESIIPTVGGFTDVLQPGEYVTIAGVARASGGGEVFHVIYIDDVGNLYLDDECDATAAGAAVAYSTPDWAEIFPAGGERFISDLPVASNDNIGVPHEASGKIWELRFKQVNGLLTPYVVEGI